MVSLAMIIDIIGISASLILYLIINVFGLVAGFSRFRGLIVAFIIFKYLFIADTLASIIFLFTHRYVNFIYKLNLRAQNWPTQKIIPYLRSAFPTSQQCRPFQCFFSFFNPKFIFSGFFLSKIRFFCFFQN